MTLRRLAPVLFLSLATTACVPAYVSPTRDDAATLTFVPEAAGYVHAHVFMKGRDCKDERRISGFGGLKGKTEIRIPPGEEIAPSINIAGGNWNCSVIMSFVPRPGEAYVAHITGSGQACKLGIGRFDGKKLVTEPSARARKWVRGRCE